MNCHMFARKNAKLVTVNLDAFEFMVKAIVYCFQRRVSIMLKKESVHPKF